jgi:hypothetical protein
VAQIKELDIQLSQSEVDQLFIFLGSNPEICREIPILQEKMKAIIGRLDVQIAECKAKIREINSDPRLQGVTSEFKRINPATGRFKAIPSAELFHVNALFEKRRCYRQSLNSSLEYKAKLQAQE